VGCLFNPLVYFCLNLVLVSAIIAGAGQFVFGNRLLQSAALFVPTILLGLIGTIVQTYLIYRYFSPPKKPPRQPFLRQPQCRESETDWQSPLIVRARQLRNFATIPTTADKRLQCNKPSKADGPARLISSRRSP